MKLQQRIGADLRSFVFGAVGGVVGTAMTHAGLHGWPQPWNWNALTAIGTLTVACVALLPVGLEWHRQRAIAKNLRELLVTELYLLRQCILANLGVDRPPLNGLGQAPLETLHALMQQGTHLLTKGEYFSLGRVSTTLRAALAGPEYSIGTEAPAVLDRHRNRNAGR